MRVLNFGSLSHDHTNATEHFVKEKETLLSLGYLHNFGGKGFNQSIAIARAGMEVCHAGKVGIDGNLLIAYLRDNGVNTDYLDMDEKDISGQAFIETCGGENRIIIYGGANQLIDDEYIDSVLKDFGEEDVLLVQNEISDMGYLIRRAHEKGLKIYFNTAPISQNVFTYPLDLVDFFIVNEVEGKALAGCAESDYQSILDALVNKYPGKEFILTVGADGAYYTSQEEMIYVPAEKVDAVDTTAAGDTFIGYFLAASLQGKSLTDAMVLATKASALCVSRKGSAQSVPYSEEITE
ncbi:MAG: ribokinase [Erysipelotrichaceae bacterium]|nr:ribokinase [Erysipelotrichaceae bacterium]